MTEKIIDESYINTKLLTEEDIILNFSFLYSYFVMWADSQNLNLTLRDIYKLYINKQITNDGTPFFYNFIKFCKYMEVNKIYGFDTH